MNKAPECTSFDWSLAPKFRAPLSCLRWEFVWTLLLDKWQSHQHFFDRHRMGYWIYYRVRAEQGLKQSLFLGLQTVWDLLYSYDSSHYLPRLQVFRCELFELLSALDRHLVDIIGPIVRLWIPSYSAVSLCICGIRCEWRTTKRISYWTFRSTSSSALATMAISLSASIRKCYQTRLANRTNVLVHLMVGMNWTSFTDFVGK